VPVEKHISSAMYENPALSLPMPMGSRLRVWTTIPNWTSNSNSYSTVY